MSRSRFDGAARQYDAGRPGYPDELFDAIEELSGSFLDAAAVADVGAGTGIATRTLLARGAHVVAVDHGVRMLGALRDRSPAVPVVLADANALPFSSHSFDLVTFAQSWHWVDLDRAPREVTRVVRRGGAVAIWWNTVDDGAKGWLGEHCARLGDAGRSVVGARFEASWAALPAAFEGFEVVKTEVSWERVVSKEAILDEARSKSYIEALGPSGAQAFIERERTLLPDGELCEPFTTRLAVVRIPAAATASSDPPNGSIPVAGLK